MLRTLGEVALGALSFVAIKDQCDKLITNSPSRITQAREGIAVGALCIGSAAAWPLTAPIGAVITGKAVYTHRREIVEFVKDLPSSAKTTYQHAKEKAFNFIGRKAVVDNTAQRELDNAVLELIASTNREVAA